MPRSIASRGLAMRDRLALDQDLALVGPVHAGQDVDQRRLAGAVVADQAERLAAVEVEGHALQRVDAGIPFVQVADRDDRRRSCLSASTLMALARLRSQALATTAKMVRKPMANLNQLASTWREHQPVVDDADQRGADDAAEHGADAAGQRRAADHRGSDRLQLQPLADRRQRRRRAAAPGSCRRSRPASSRA